MKLIYQAEAYGKEKVTGIYAICKGRKSAYRFRFFETASYASGKSGEGRILREYETDGAELTTEQRGMLIKSKQTECLFKGDDIFPMMP